MADVAVVAAEVASAPQAYTLPGAQEILLKAVGCTINGSGAAGTFLPALQMLDPAGHVMWTAVNESSPVAVGRSALVSWFPGGGVDNAGPTTTTPGISSVSSPLGTLSVLNPTGPTVNLDMPNSGVTAGSYGDSSHSAEITVDVEGRVTSATSVPIAGGSGTIGFEIGYDQITSFVTVSATTEATGTTVITCGAHTFDGAPVLAMFFAPGIQTAAVSQLSLTVCLFEGSTEIGRLCVVSNASATQDVHPGIGILRFTPSAGSHTYKVTAFVNNATATSGVVAGAGGTAAYDPAFIRFTKV